MTMAMLNTQRSSLAGMRAVRWLVVVSAVISFTSPPACAKAGDRLVLQKVGTCVVSGHEQQLSDWVNENIPSNEYRQRSAIVLGYVSNCLPKFGLSSANLSPWNLDALVSEALIRTLFATKDPGDLGDVIDTGEPLNPIGRPAKMPNERLARSKAFQRYVSKLESEIVIAATECFVRTNSSDVRAFLLTEAESKEETSKLSSLKDTIAACMPSNSDFQLNISETRNWMAMNYRTLASIKVKGN